MDKLIKAILMIISVYFSILSPSAIIFGVLIVAELSDYLVKIFSLLANGEPIDMTKAIQGIFRKINNLFIVLVALTIDILITYNFSPDKAMAPVSTGVITWLIVNELISICKNIVGSGDKVPDIINRVLEIFRKG